MEIDTAASAQLAGRSWCREFILCASALEALSFEGGDRFGPAWVTIGSITDR
jgi:hypothetical protein